MLFEYVVCVLLTVAPVGSSVFGPFVEMTDSKPAGMSCLDLSQASTDSREDTHCTIGIETWYFSFVIIMVMAAHR